MTFSMTFAYDPEIGVALETASGAGAALPSLPPRGDGLALRKMLCDFNATFADAPLSAGVSRHTVRTLAADGNGIDLHWFTKSDQSSEPGPAVLYVHGGGMVYGSVDIYAWIISDYVAATGVPMLAPSYRLAPEHRHPTPVNDVFAGLLWLRDNATALNVDPARIAVMGDSAGGGLAAAVALMARENGMKLARQILIYPMLDDRNIEPDEAMLPFASWTYDDNFTGWSSLLGPAFGTESVSPFAAPARASDLSGVAPAYIEVGELDIFRDEDLEYGRRLAKAGVSTELHLHPGAPHGFERMAPESDVARRAMADRYRVLASL
jgi:acetyl esterase/lipase